MATSKSKKRERRRNRSIALTGGICFLCGEVLREDWTRDHLLPTAFVNTVLQMPNVPDFSRYGFAVTVPACDRCNARKASRMPTIQELRRFVDMHDSQPLHKPIPLHPFVRELADAFPAADLNVPLNPKKARRWLHERFTTIPGRVVMYGGRAIPADLGVNQETTHEHAEPAARRDHGSLDRPTGRRDVPGPERPAPLHP